jgi:hypothetical protein
MKLLPPPQAALVSDIWARNQDWDGHEEIADRLKATVPPAIVQATVKGPDGKPLPPQPQPPDPMMVKQLEKITAEIENLKAAAAKNIVQAKQLDRQDAIMDFPGGNEMPGQPPVPMMQKPGARPNYLQ